MIFEIEFNETPISTQHAYGNFAIKKRVVRFMTTKAKNYKKELSELSLSNFGGGQTTKDLEGEVWLYFPDKRKRDIDNFHKLWMDALEGIVYEDDRQIKDLLIHKVYRKGNGGIRIKLSEKNGKEQDV